MYKMAVSEFHETGESFDAGKHGKDYEIEIAKFVLKRVFDNEFNNFRFTREKKGVGKFDDLVLISEMKEVLTYTLIQLKHCLDDSKQITFESLAQNKNSPFYLPKYYDHYVESLKSISEDHDFSNAKLRELIICTNIGFHDNLSFIEKVKLNNERLFKNSGVLYRIFISNACKRAVFVENYVSTQTRLANELCNYVMLDKQIDISSLVKDEHVSIIKYYHVGLAKNVIDVHGSKFKTEFLENTFDKNSDLFSFRESLFNAFNEFYVNYKDLESDQLKYQLNITRKKADHLKALLREYELKGGVKLLKRLHLNVRGKFGNPALYPNDYQNLPSSELNFDEVDKQIDKFLSVLTFAAEQKNNENIIRQELSPDIMIAYTDKMNHWYHSGSCEDAGNRTGRKREWITKAKLTSQAMDTNILLQGRRINMRQLVNNEYLFDSHILMNVFCSQEIHVGNELRGNEKNLVQFYIPRVLTHQRQLDKSVLKQGRIDVLLISHLDDSSGENDILELLPEGAILFDLQNVKLETRFVYVPKNFREEDFTHFVNKYSENFEWKSIHWIEILEKRLYWRKTFGSLSILHKYFFDDDIDAETLNETELSTTGPFVIVVGEPGMGKSTLLQNAGISLITCSERNKTPVWVFEISLGDCAQMIRTRDLDSFRDFNGIIEFLAESGKVKGTFCKTILRYCLLNCRIILILDAFDELSSRKDENKMIQLLSYLRNNSKIKQIWISTRPHLKHLLENCLGTISFSIKEISEEQQIEFLYKFWKHSNACDEHILRHSTKLVQYFNTQIKDHKKKFLGIPLQTYMFAVAFLQEIDKDDPVIQTSIPLNFLFRQFLHAQYKIYLQKSGEVRLPEDMKQLLMQSLDEAHQNFALLYGGCLPAEMAQLFTIEGKTITKSTLLKIGIVYKCNDSLHFVHKTLCEYLVAKRMSDVVLHNEKNSKDCGSSIEELISNSENQFLIYLFDSELTEMFPLHRAVLNGDSEKVRNFQKYEIDAKDCLGRSLAYYAVQYNHFHIIKMLLHMQGFSGDFDHFLMKSLIRYVKSSYNSSLDQLQKNDKLFVLLLRYSSHYSLNLIEAFDLHLELKFRSWTLVRKLLMIYRGNLMFDDSVVMLESALKYGAPLDIVMFILENIKIYEKPLDPSLMSYSNFMKYIFVCEPQSIKKLLRQYKSSFSTLYTKLPLFVGIYDYFNLSKISFGVCLCSLLASVKERASRYTVIVQLLLENGASYAILPNGNIEDVFSETQFSITHVKQPIKKFLEEKYHSTFLDSPLNAVPKEGGLVEMKRSYCIKDSTNELWSNLGDYEKEIPLDTSHSVTKSVLNVAKYILKSSDAEKLLHVVFNFFEAIKTSNYEGVLGCLKTAKESGWTKALLGATNGDFKTAEDLAKRKMNLRISLLLRKHRSHLRSSATVRKWMMQLRR